MKYMRLLLPLMVLLSAFLFLIPTKAEAGSATILGRVYKEGSDTAGFTHGRYYYGDDCGTGSGYGGPNYTIYWSQNGITHSIRNNSCYGAGGGVNRPRFTFENTDNPDPGPVTIRVVMDDPNVLLTGFEGWTTDDGNNILPGSSEKITFAQRGPDQTFTRTVRDTNGFHWNHTAIYWYVNSSSCQSISVSKTILSPGESFTSSVQMLNNGTTTWSKDTNHRLGSQHSPDNLFGSNRANLQYDVGPNSLYDFSFNATAPTNPGTYEFKWQMVQDGVEWFGPTCGPINIRVESLEAAALFPIADCSISPTTILQNQSATWSISNVRRGDGKNYTYRWYGDDGLSKTVTNTTTKSDSVNQTYSTIGIKKAYVDITSAGLTTTIKFDNTSGANCSPLIVNQSVPELRLTCSPPQPASGQLETQFILNSSASGGSGNYIYYWNIQEPNRYPKLLGGTSSSSSIPWTPTTEGTTNATATVYSGGQSASCSVDFNVKGHQPSSFSPGNVTSFCAGANNPRMDVTWTASKYATSYKIDRWTLINGNIAFEKTIDTIPSNGLIQFQAEKNNDFTYRYWFSDSNAPFYTTTYYFYHITAINNNGSTDTWVVGSNGISCPAPSVYLQVNGSDGPVTLNEGATPTVSWTSENTYSCYVNTSKSNVWPGYHYTSGEKTEPLLASRSPVTFFIQCSGITAGTYADDQVIVNVTPPPPSPPPSPPPLPPLSVSCQPDPSQILIGGFTDWIARVSGGKEPYDVTFPGGELKGKKAKEVFDGDGKLTYQGRATYSTAGTYSQDVLVKSKDGQSKQITCSSNVTAANNPPGSFFFNTASTTCQNKNQPEVNLSWTLSDYALNYWVGRTDEDGWSNYTAYKPLPKSELNFNDTDVVPNKTYIYFVFSENPYGMGTAVLADPSAKPSWDSSSPEFAFLQQVTTQSCKTMQGTVYLNNTSTPFTGSFTVNSTDKLQEVDYKGKGNFTIYIPDYAGSKGHYNFFMYIPTDHQISSADYLTGQKCNVIDKLPCSGIFYGGLPQTTVNLLPNANMDIILKPTSSLAAPPGGGGGGGGGGGSGPPASSKPPYIQTKDGDVHSNIEIKGSQ